jgi:hypothetical protein
MKSTKEPTKGRSNMKKRKHGPCRARTCDRRIMREVSGAGNGDKRPMGHRSSEHSPGIAAPSKPHPKRDGKPTIRPTNRRRKKLIHDITARSLRR